MKEKIIYIVVFLGVFVITTSGIIYLNNNYTDIFKFNFTPVLKAGTSHSDKTNGNNISMTELKAFLQKELKNDIVDSLKTIYSGVQNTNVSDKPLVIKDSSLIDSIKNLRQVIQRIDLQLSKQESENKAQQATEIKETVKKDSSYVNWTKQTAKLYEAMDPRKAAKIIQSYSDNVARDILYSMRQKKAAEIMSELNPETANRITQAKSNAF